LAVQVAVDVAGAVELAVGALLANRSTVLASGALEIALPAAALIEGLRLVVAAARESQRRSGAGRNQDD